MAESLNIPDETTQVQYKNMLISLVSERHPEMALRLTRHVQSIRFRNNTVIVSFDNAIVPKNDSDFFWLKDNFFDFLILANLCFRRNVSFMLFSYNPNYEICFNLNEEKKIFCIPSTIDNVSIRNIKNIKIGAHPYPFVVMQCLPLSINQVKEKFSIKSFDEKYIFTMSEGYYLDEKFKAKKTTLPYGGPARTILSAIFSISKISNSPVVYLGKNVSETCRILNFNPNGSAGRKPLTQLISIGHSKLKLHVKEGDKYKVCHIFNKYFPLWQKKEFFSRKVGSYIVLNKEFFDNYISKGAIPSQFNSYFSMNRCPLAMDIYLWLNFRMNQFPVRTIELKMPLEKLISQFNYCNNDVNTFKHGFIRALKNHIYKFWPELENEEAIRFVIEDGEHFLKIKKIKPHVNPLKKT